MTDEKQAFETFKGRVNEFKKTHPILTFIYGVIAISSLSIKMYTGLYKSIWKGTENDRTNIH